VSDSDGMAFVGWGPDAVAWLTEIRVFNERSWFHENKARYEREVRGPMLALLDELAGLFGPGKVFRPNRDVRFSRNKEPYKPWVAATIGEEGRVAARYVQLDAERLLVGAGAYGFEREALQRYRQAVLAEASGRPLDEIVRALRDEGYEIGGETLKRGPRDVDPEHPRIGLLKHTGLTMRQTYEVDAWLADPGEVLARVVPPLVAAEPLLAWMRDHVA